MDGLDMQTPVDFSKLSDRDKQELNQFIINESQLGARRKGQCKKTPGVLTFPFFAPAVPSAAASSPLGISINLKANISNNIAIHSLTDTCWKKCITSRISSAKLERAEDSCVQNCVDRFMDGTNLVLKQLEEMRQAGQV
ncbi:MAG: Mitochondrial import inner membrane translocase subunit tim8 [Icmadophila ericetorum]|nr:Mitochondrial import inner membrane translocase subunit tim8 [Icmadophila ericetorum]